MNHDQSFLVSVSVSCLCERYQFREAGKTKFHQVVRLDNAPTIKPAKNVTKPKPPDKRARDSRETVLSLIFSSFKTHEFYTFKDLVHKTKQPPVSPSGFHVEPALLPTPYNSYSCLQFPPVLVVLEVVHL